MNIPPQNSEIKTLRPFTEEEQKKVSAWSKHIREKHSVPANFHHIISRGDIDEYIKWTETSDYIFIYDDQGLLCKCSYGKITPILKDRFDGNGTSVQERVRSWKEAMREKFHVLDGHEVIMNYSNGIDWWMAYCEQRQQITVKDSQGRYFSLGADCKPVYMPSFEEYIYGQKNEYCRDHGDMQQSDADNIGHFTQIIATIQASQWHKHQLRLQHNMSNDGLTRASMPSLDETILALLYVRQLTDNRDHVLNTACNTFKRFSSSSHKIKYIKEQQKWLEDYLAEEPRHVELSKLVQSNLQLVEVFQYGSLLFHAPESINDPQSCDIFKKMYLDKKHRTDYIFELNMTMRTIFNHASNIATFIQKDFAHWIDQGQVPKPDIIWQISMFSWLETIEGEPQKEAEPIFDQAFNVQISEVKE